jgi:hypothetical protein
MCGALFSALIPHTEKRAKTENILINKRRLHHTTTTLFYLDRAMVFLKKRMRDSNCLHLVLAFLAGAIFVSTLQFHGGVLETRSLDGGERVPTADDKKEIITRQQTNPNNYVEELMYTYKSDKSRDDHSYVKLYNMIFANIRHSITNITEIGISHGQSIQAWFRYFQLGYSWI